MFEEMFLAGLRWLDIPAAERAITSLLGHMQIFLATARPCGITNISIPFFADNNTSVRSSIIRVRSVGDEDGNFGVLLESYQSTTRWLDNLLTIYRCMVLAFDRISLCTPAPCCNITIVSRLILVPLLNNTPTTIIH